VSNTTWRVDARTLDWQLLEVNGDAPRLFATCSVLVNRYMLVITGAQWDNNYTALHNTTNAVSVLDLGSRRWHSV